MKVFKHLWWIILLVLVGALVYWSWATRGRTKRTYTATAGVYELDMRVQIRSKEPGSIDGRIIKGWRMDIPYAYIYKRYGLNGVARHKRSGEKNNFAITLDTMLDPETMTLNPHPNRRSGAGEYAVTISLNNAMMPRKRHSVDQCLNYDEWAEIFDNRTRNFPACREDVATKRCSASMHVDGWSVKVTLDKKLYYDRQQYCEVVKEFLQSLTVSRDNLILEKPTAK